MLQVMPYAAWDTNKGSIALAEDTGGDAACSTKPQWAVAIRESNPGPHSHWWIASPPLTAKETKCPE